MGTDLEGVLQAFAAFASSYVRRRLRFSHLAAGWLALVMIGRPPPMTLLDPSDRERALAAMAKSRSPELRQLLRVLKLLKRRADALLRSG
mgnify:CR=1 FL=1